MGLEEITAAVELFETVSSAAVNLGTKVYTLVAAAEIAPDDKDALIARIQAAQASVPKPDEG